MSNSMDDVAEFAEAALIIGSNTTEQHPVFGTMLRRAVNKRGLKIVVADPRKIPLVKFVTLWLRHRPGTDSVLLNAMMHVILAEGLEDKAFITERTKVLPNLPNH